MPAGAEYTPVRSPSLEILPITIMTPLGRALAVSLVLASSATAASLPPDSSYVLLFADEFDGTTVNEKDWVYRLDRRGGEANFSGIRGLNRRENVRVSDGLLRVRVDQEIIDGKKENTGGGVLTKKRFGYGYYECRYRPLMKGNGGVHTAFWQRGPSANVLAGQLLDPTTPAQNILFEIDSSELDNPHWVGTNNLYDVIAPKGMSDGYPWPARFHIPVQPLEGGWFIDAYEYTPEGIIFYDNHVEVARIRYDRIRGQQNVWLTALNGFGTIKDTSIYPGECDFDYFRFYAKDYPGANLISNEGFEYNLDSVDPQEPIAWHEAGDVFASSVSEGGAFLASAKLRHSSEKSYKTITSQTLHYILDGDYAASAMVRSSGGQRVARLSVGSPGGESVSVAIPATSAWTRILIPTAKIVGNEATVSIESDADAGQWIEVDDVQFLKPAAPDQLVVKSKAFESVTDPIWRLCDGPTAFRDGTYSFFGREVGLGESITVAFSMKPDAVRDQVVLERMPRTGDSGWGVRLTAAGDVVLRIGSVENHTDVVAKNAYVTGRAARVAAVFDRGTARLYIDGREVAVRENIPQRTLDKKAAGSVGSQHRTSTKEPYSGILQDIRVHNRALSAREISALAAP
ncbi:MAG: hypothetical protein RLZZ50_132 [Verrucomicrobiota bacterium]